MTTAGPLAAVIVLAAGSGTRMHSKTAKVLHQLGGRSMLGHVLGVAGELAPERVVVVVGHSRDQVAAHARELVEDVVVAVQDSPDGTGHAVRAAVEALSGQVAPSGTVVVLGGDTPLLESRTLLGLLAEHEAGRQAGARVVTMLSSVLEDPFGYGRVLRDPDGVVAAIVEEKDASPAERELREVGVGVYAFDLAFLAEALPRLSNDNAKGEYYLTDLIALARGSGAEVGAWAGPDPGETEGANDRAQLAALAGRLNQRVLQGWMRAGVTVIDPASTWVDTDVRLTADVTLLPGVQLLGATTVEEDAVIGPDTTCRDTEIGAGARVVRTHAQLAVIGPGADVGPFAYLRPGTRLEARAKVGTFVETKNAHLAEGAKVPHLSYVGDADIGRGSNIGAGTVFANYDGVSKHRTRIGEYVATGSNNTFVAPVTVGDGAATGAGSLIRHDVPPGALAVSAGPQRHLLGWVLERRAGTTAAHAAAAAAGTDLSGSAGEGGASATPDPG